jgi:hypothetical protein
MLKTFATIGFLLLSAGALIAGSFYVLETACSLPGQIESAADKNSETSKPSKNNPPEKTQQAQPSATFDLRVTNPNTIEGNYYAPKDNWTRNFFCETKLGEFALACFTFFLVIFTALLWRSTEKLSIVTENSTKIAQATEIPIPLISAFKLVQYEAIPGENSILDPVPGGVIPQNCRILFVVENKGRLSCDAPSCAWKNLLASLCPVRPPTAIFVHGEYIWRKARFGFDPSTIRQRSPAKKPSRQIPYNHKHIKMNPAPSTTKQ